MNFRRYFKLPDFWRSLATVCIATSLAIGCAKQTPTARVSEVGDAADSKELSESVPVEIIPEQLKFTDIRSEEHAPFANKETKAIVLVFIATDCPIANYFQPTLTELATISAPDDVSFFLVHSDPDVEMEAATQHAADFSISAPVVLDNNQSIAKMLNAKVTPEAFVIDREGTIRYRGRINDLYADFGKRRAKATTHDLRDAIEAIVHGKAVVTFETKAIGCYIPYPNKAESRAGEPTQPLPSD